MMVNAILKALRLSYKMLFCPTCDRAMVRSMATGAVTFKCTSCLREEKGAPADARVSGAVHGASEATEMYRRLIETACYDRTNQLVLRDPCPDCGLDYAVQLRIGAAEVVIYKCKCGRETSGAEAAAAPAP